MRKLFATLMILVGASGFAGSCDPCCYQDDCCMDWCGGWSVCVDYLYWRPTRSGLDYATVVAPGVGTAVGKICEVDPDYDSGVRVALYKENDCTNGFYGVRYAHFDTKTSDSKTSALADSLFPTRADAASLGTALAAARASYEVCYDVVDLMFGRVHCFECVDAFIRPYAGVKLAWIDQKMKTNYIFTDTITVLNDVKQRLDMDAYGLSCGFDGRIGFCDGSFGLTGRAQMSLLHACFCEKVFIADIDSVNQNARYDDIKDIVPVFEVGVGLDWWFCCCECWDFGVEVGYEFQTWRTPDFLTLNPNITTFMSPDRSRAFLGFQGLYVRLCVGF